MLDFVYQIPTRFVFGHDAQDAAGAQACALGAHKVLLHYGGGSVVRSGLLDRVKASLDKADIAYVELGGVKPNPRLSLAKQGIELCRKEGVDLVLAVGGGSTIDSAKCIALGVRYQGDVWDFYRDLQEGQTRPTPDPISVAVVLTIPAAGSESSAGSVITNEDGWFKRAYSCEGMRPKFALMNPELTFTLPDYQTACGVTDMYAHVLERYFTNTPNTVIIDRLAEGVLKTLIDVAPRVLQDPQNYDLRAEIMWCGTIAHNNTVGVGREQDWASHNIEHELSAKYDIAHGAGLAIVFPAWMTYCYKHDIKRFVMYAKNVYGVQTQGKSDEEIALEGIACTKAFFQKIGMPVSLRELNVEINDDILMQMAQKVARNPHGKVGNFVRLSPEDIVEIYKLALD